MQKNVQQNSRLKRAVNRLLVHNPYIEPPTRRSLMHQIKNIIETNKELNHRFMDFNYTKEFKQMKRTMNKFNSEQNNKKNLVSKLSKENNFFAKSYPNIISSLAIKVDKKNINYQTISNFNQKYDPTNHSKEDNFFYEDPLLLTKSKDLDNFYINLKNPSTKKDVSLNYSKKLLLGLNSNSPLNRVLKIIDKHNLKTGGNNYFEEEEYLSDRPITVNNQNIENVPAEQKPLSERKNNYFAKNNKFYNKKTDPKKKKEINEIIMLKRYNKNIKKLLGTSNSLPKKNSQIHINFDKLSSILNQNPNNYKRQLKFKKNTILKNNNLNNNIIPERRKRNVRFNTIFSSQNIVNNYTKQFNEIKPLKINDDKEKRQNSDFIKKDLEKMFPIKNDLYKEIKKKLNKVKKLKGSIQIQNIYNDLVKTKETVNEYETKKEPKLKYLYSLYCDKNFYPFQKEERENYQIKKLDRDLFWTVNEFHNN